MRSLLVLVPVALVLAALAACGDDDGSTFNGGGPGSSNGSSGAPCVGVGCAQTYPDGGRPGCTGLGCSQVDCEGGLTTTVTGKVFDPAGKVGLYNVVVYVPNGELAPITAGLGPTCDRCDSSFTSNPIAIAHTDANGAFTLKDVPAGVDFPVVMQIGKWRRKITIPKVERCQTAAASSADTRLPRNRSEGDMPRIALTTGSADPLECLLRKIGVDASEFGVAGSESRIHLYAGGSTSPATATSSLEGGTAFQPATAVWGGLSTMEPYDIVMLSCEGGEKAATKPEAARTALYEYAKKGGRVFTTHYHHYWFSNSPLPEVKGLASWTNDYTCTPGPGCPTEPEPLPDVTVNATLNTSFPKGVAMRDWLAQNGALSGPNGTLPIVEARHNVSAVNANAISWMTIQNPAAENRTAHEYVSFNAPIGASDAEVCGRVVYTDLHVGAGDATGVPFPTGCNDKDLTPQQKALEFMFFDLASCVQRDDQPVK